MPGKTLKQEIADVEKYFISEGLLVEDFSANPEGYEDEIPYFSEESVTIFFDESAKVIANIEEQLEKDLVDFDDILNELLKIRRGSNMIGAISIANKVFDAVNCQTENLESFESYFNKMKEEIDTMKEKLEAYFQLLKLAAARDLN